MELDEACLLNANIIFPAASTVLTKLRLMGGALASRLEKRV